MEQSATLSVLASGSEYFMTENDAYRRSGAMFGR
jgi:hypothetical protein